MKYTISQQRLNDFRNSYLEGVLDNVSMMDNFIIINGSHESDDIEDDVIMEYDYEDGRLYINKGFYQRFSDMLFPNEDYWIASNFIMNWFENTFGVNVEYSQTK